MSLRDVRSLRDNDPLVSSSSKALKADELTAEGEFGTFHPKFGEEIARRASEASVVKIVDPADGPGDDMDDWAAFRRRSLGAPSSSAGSRRSSRHMSIASLAVQQNQRNREYLVQQAQNLRELEEQKAELENFVENSEWATDSGVGLGGWKKACLQTMVTTRKAANVMLRGTRKLVCIFLVLFGSC